MKIIYYTLISFINLTIIFSQGITFPSEPQQAPIGGLGLLVATGVALAYKKFKK
tara:strand:+ start:402 stop:563 length:162 start_codon:yes stop_codon:yes gene_type:complete